MVEDLAGWIYLRFFNSTASVVSMACTFRCLIIFLTPGVHQFYLKKKPFFTRKKIGQINNNIYVIWYLILSVCLQYVPQFNSRHIFVRQLLRYQDTSNMILLHCKTRITKIDISKLNILRSNARDHCRRTHNCKELLSSEQQLSDYMEPLLLTRIDFILAWMNNYTHH